MLTTEIVLLFNQHFLSPDPCSIVQLFGEGGSRAVGVDMLLLVLGRECFHHFRYTFHFLGFALSHPSGIEVAADLDLVTASCHEWPLDLQEFWNDPWFGFKFEKSSFENELIGVRRLATLSVLLVLIFSKHNLKEKAENLSCLFGVREQERIERYVVVVIQFFQIALQLLTNAKFVSLNLNVLIFEPLDVDEVVIVRQLIGDVLEALDQRIDEQWRVELLQF